jgi:hypothetical protein
MRSRALFLLSSVGAAAVALGGAPSEAKACGGCFHEPSQSGDVITDHRMIFRITPQQTTLYDEIEYTGSPQSFAWVLPIHGPVTVGLGSDLVFAALDQVTKTQIFGPPPPQCPSCPFCGTGSGSGAGGGSSGSSSGGFGADAGTGVVVISQQTVGPYDTVQLQSTDPNALTNWLTANGYAIPTSVQPVIAAYVTEGFDFLALRLAPGQGVSAMRPVRVTSAGAGLSLPLRMVSAGTGATVGIALWVIGDGRYEPQNFASFIISPNDLVWDWSTQQSNYATLRAQKEAALNDAVWQIESALQISPFQIEQPVLYSANDYLPIPASDAGADGGASAGETADQVRQDDLAVLFPSMSQVWITRMRADLSHAALATDLVVQASATQTELSNIYNVTQSVNAPTCPPLPNPCPPCNQGGSSGGSGSGGSSGGPFGTGSSSGGPGGIFGGGGGPGGIFGGGGASGAQTGSGGGCSTARNDDSGSGVPIGVGALIATALVLGRNKRRR